MQMSHLEFFSSHARAWISVISFCVVLFLHVVRRSRRTLPFPPGPKGLPIVGNALDMPCKNPWLTYGRWGKQYGGHLSLLDRGYTLHLRNGRF